MSLKILILGVNYAPELTGIGPMTTEFAEDFARAGHEVVVATTFPFYPKWRWYEPPGLRTVETRNGVEVRRFRMLLPRDRGAAWRILSDTSFTAATLPNVVGIRRPDCIVAVSPPVQVAVTAAILRQFWGSPVCLLVKDLPLEAALATGMMRGGRLYRAGLALERWSCRLADHIVVIDEAMRVNLAAKGIAAERISSIPDWIDVRSIRPVEAEPHLRNVLGARNGEFLALHTGNMGEKQGLLNLIDATSHLRDLSRFRITLMGEGSQRPLIEAAVEGQQLSNVKLLPLQPAELFHRLLGAADALVVNQCANVVDSVAPSKLLSYMAAGRPVVAAVNEHSVAARLVRESGGGVVVPAEDPPALALALEHLSNDPDMRSALGRAGREYVERTFDKGPLMVQWERLLVSLSQRRRE